MAEVALSATGGGIAAETVETPAARAIRRFARLSDHLPQLAEGHFAEVAQVGG